MGLMLHFCRTELLVSAVRSAASYSFEANTFSEMETEMEMEVEWGRSAPWWWPG